MAGLTGSVVLSIFSTELDESGFSVVRSVPATAVIFTEPDVTVPGTSISRSSSYSASESGSFCNRPLIPLGRKINAVKNPVLSKFERILNSKRSPVIDRAYNKFQLAYQKITRVKATFYQKLGLSCLVPKIMRRFSQTNFYKIIQTIKCKLGVHEDNFMEAPTCNSTRCIDPVVESREITNDLNLPNLDNDMLPIATLDDCFQDMNKVVYGARVLIKVIDDVSCEEEQYKDLCASLIEENRIVQEEECELPG